MQIKIGKVVNADGDVNLADLKPLDRVIAAATNAYHGTTLYKRKHMEEVEKREQQMRKIREALTDALLTIIRQELVDNILLSTKGDTCKAILVQSPYKFEPFLQDVITSHELDAYIITVIKPNQFLSTVAEVPSLLHIRSKEVMDSD